MFDTINQYYDWGLFTKRNLRDMVRNTGWITAKQYREITGEVYEDAA